jgi:hypothetical protein
MLKAVLSKVTSVLISESMVPVAILTLRKSQVPDKTAKSYMEIMGSTYAVVDIATAVLV